MRYLTAVFALLLLPVAASAQTAADAEFGVWNYVENRDAVTQEQADFIMYAPESREYAFSIKCVDSGPVAAMVVADLSDKMAMVTGRDYAYLSYRVGSQLTREEQRWSYDTGDDLAVSSNVEGRHILRAMKNASGTFGFRIYNAEGQSVTTDEIPLSGIGRAISNLSCAG